MPERPTSPAEVSPDSVNPDPDGVGPREERPAAVDPNEVTATTARTDAPAHPAGPPVTDRIAAPPPPPPSHGPGHRPPPAVAPDGGPTDENRATDVLSSVDVPRDTTEGDPVPMGQRDATVADTLPDPPEPTKESHPKR